MGTRHLIMVIKDQTTKVAQYGQWDGYPSGQGFMILDFFRNNDLEKFRSQLDKVHWITEEKNKEVDDFNKSLSGWDSYKLFNEKYPELSRDTGSGILDIIMKTEKELYLIDNSDFIKDAIFCEWSYIINLDDNTLKVNFSKTFDLTKLPSNEEFRNVLGD